MKNFKSYGFWTALAGAIVVLINSIGRCFGFAVEEEVITNIVMAVAGVLVVFGVVSMPKGEDDGKNEKQDEEVIEIEEDSTDENQEGQ